MSIPGPADGIAWVTGASSGIGREVAAQLAQAGWTVAVSARRHDALQSLADSYPGQMIVAPLVRPARVPLVLWWSHSKIDRVVRVSCTRLQAVTASLNASALVPPS